MPKVKKSKTDSKKEEIKSSADKFLVSLDFGNDIKYQAESENLLQAMDAIKPDKIIGRAMLKVSRDGKSVEKLLFIWPIRKFIGNQAVRTVWANLMEKSLK